MQYEEAIVDLDNQIEANTKLLEENAEAIRQTTAALQDAIRKEIEAKIHEEKNMLAGTVNMQKEIMEAIKNRYQKEWDLIKEDLERKKSALEEEKNLINERLQARKESEDEAAQYEKLEELKKQLELVSMDATRTKDAAELRKQIADLEKEQNLKRAQDEVNATTQAIDDTIQAYTDQEELGDKDLEMFLKDANNLASEVTALLEQSSDDIYAWLMENVEDFANMLPESQQQMLDSWEETYKQMKGIVDRYYEEIALYMSSEDAYMEFMKANDKDYRDLLEEFNTANALGDTERAFAAQENMSSMEYSWKETWDNWTNAHKDDNLTYDHDDDWLNEKIDSISTDTSSIKDSSKSTSEAFKAKLESDKKQADALAAIKKAQEDGLKSSQGIATMTFERQAIISDTISRISDAAGEIVETVTGRPWKGTASATATTLSGSTIQTSQTTPTLTAFATGGLADYTGLAWLDGTPQNPEYVLSSTQWKDLLNVAALDFIPSNLYSNGDTNIGTVNVTINEASISSDADIAELANRVGEQFTNQLSLSGFNTSRYAR